MDRTGHRASAASREVGALLRQRGGQMLPAPWPHAQALSSVMRWVAAVDEVVDRTPHSPTKQHIQRHHGREVKCVRRRTVRQRARPDALAGQSGLGCIMIKSRANRSAHFLPVVGEHTSLRCDQVAVGLDGKRRLAVERQQHGQLAILRHDRRLAALAG